MTKYILNEEGGVHSVTDEHFENVLHETSEGGRRFLKYGWTEITAEEAKRLHPQLFGAQDRSIVLTSKEIKEVRERREFERELAAEEAEFTEEAEEPTEPPQPEPTPAPTPGAKK